MFRNFTLLIFTTIFILRMASCTNDNEGYKEYYHPMGNNPVQVVPWLKDLKKSFYQNEARISLYELDKQKYYAAQVFVPTDSLIISPFTIYKADKREQIVYFHTADVLIAEQDAEYINFIENADLINVLWSNERKYSIME